MTIRVVSNPVQHVKAVHLWHLDVEKKNRRKRELFPIGKFAAALQIADDLFAICDDLNGILQPKIPKSMLEQKGIILWRLGL
jgi:hypothetical protein